RNIIAVAVRDEDEVRGAGGKDSAETQRDAGELLSFVPKDFALIKMADAFGVLEDEDAIVLVGVEVHLVIAVGIELGNPKATTVVECHGDRLVNVRLRSEHAHLKARWHADTPGRLRDGQQLVNHGRFARRKREKKSYAEENRTNPPHWAEA